MALTATHLVVIGRGRLIADLTVEEMLVRASRDLVRVRTTHADRLAQLVTGDQVQVEVIGAEELLISGHDSASIGRLAADHAIPLVELTPLKATLEQAFMELTSDAVEYQTNPMSDASSPTSNLSGSPL